MSSAASSKSADSARLAPVVSRRINCLIASEEAKRLCAHFPGEAEALAKLWAQDPVSAIEMLTAAAWDTAMTAGYLRDPSAIEAAVTCLLSRDLDGYDRILFQPTAANPAPGAYIDDERESDPRLAGDAILDGYLAKLAAVGWNRMRS
jgi:hypothetical protein